MAFNEIQMWADMISQEDAYHINYTTACTKAMSHANMNESSEDTKVRQIDPADYGFSAKAGQSIYSKQSIGGKVAILSENVDGEFASHVVKSYPNVKISPLVAGSSQGMLVEGQYDDLLDVWSMSQYGAAFGKVPQSSAKDTALHQFNDAFFSGMLIEDDVDPLNESIDITECGFNEAYASQDDGYGCIVLNFSQSDSDEPTCQKFFDMLQNEHQMHSISMSRHNINGPYETCKIYGNTKDLKDAFAIWNGKESWDDLLDEQPDAEVEFDDYYEEGLNEADRRELISHGLDMVGVKASTANVSGQDEVEMSLCEAEEDCNDKKSTSDGAEMKPFRVHWKDADGKVTISNVVASSKKAAEDTIAAKNDGCIVNNVEDLSKVYKKWKSIATYDEMMNEATLANALSQEDLSKLNSIEAKLSNDGATAEQKAERKAKLEMFANKRANRINATRRALASMEKPYEGMDKDQISQELTARHGFVGNEVSLFWKVADILGYSPEDIAGMTDQEVVEAITMHIPKGRKQRFQGYIDPMIQNRAFVDDGGGMLDKDGKPGKTGDWSQFYASVKPTDYSPAQLDMMHNDEDIDDRRSRQSKVIQLSRSIAADDEKKRLSQAIPSKGQDTWMADEVTRLMKSMPRPKARKILSTIIDDIKREYGIEDKYITGDTPVPDDIKQRCAQDILFLKSLFGKDIGMGPTLRDYPVAWGKDASGEYVSHTTAGQYNDETELLIGKAMAKTMNKPYIAAGDRQQTLTDIISDASLCVKFIEHLKNVMSTRSYGSKFLNKPSKNNN